MPLSRGQSLLRHTCRSSAVLGSEKGSNLETTKPEDKSVEQSASVLAEGVMTQKIVALVVDRDARRMWLSHMSFWILESL
eukprot:1510247-Amphidinium_carterae.1